MAIAHAVRVMTSNPLPSSFENDPALSRDVRSHKLLGNWEAKVKEYLADLQIGITSLDTNPQSLVNRQEIFEIKRQIVTTLVRRVTIDCNRELPLVSPITCVSKLFEWLCPH